MGLVQADQPSFDLRKVYFVGTNTLVEGQPLCYQEIKANSTKGYGMDVEIPNTDNERYFAGIVAPSSVGVVGPAYIDIIVPRPGDIMEVLISNGADLAVGDLLKMNFDVPTLAGAELGAFDLAMALAASTTTSGSTIANALLKGICRVANVSVASSASSARVLRYVKFERNS